MLKAEVQEQIAQLLKVDKTAFLAALKSDKEVEIEIPEGLQVFTADELKTRDTNQKKLGYGEGTTAGLEIFVKEQKQKLGLEFDGKDPSKLVEALRDKVLADAKIEPNEKLKEKDTQIASLQKNIQEYEAKFNTSEQKIKDITRRGKLVAVVPAGLPIDADEVIMSMESRGYSFEEDDKGNIVPKKNGEILRDTKTTNPLEYKAVIGDYITNERKWVPAEESKNGRGGGSDRRTAGVIGSVKAAKEEWQAQGKSINSAGFQAFVTDAAKDNKDFNWDEE